MKSPGFHLEISRKFEYLLAKFRVLLARNLKMVQI